MGGAWFYQSLPGHLQENKNISQKIVIKDRHGQVVRSYSYGDSYDWLALSDMPEDLTELIVLAEDKNFYSHHGIDLKSSLRSVLLNLKEMKVVSGASTITQQVYRQSFSIDRSLVGKLKTIAGSIKVERHYSKNEILEKYLNTLPYAQRLVGVKRAGEVLFGKDLHLLGLSELATLAILPRSPSGLKQRPEKLLKQRNDLLSVYGELKKIPRLEIIMAQKDPISFNHDYSGWDNYHYAKNLFSEKDFLSHISSNGRVETTLDLYLQKEVQAILRTQLKELTKFDVHHGAVMVMDNHQGDVLAYVGSQDVLNTNGGQYDALQLKRQPGSALKPMTFALALIEGHKLSNVLPDIPSYYKTGLGQFLPRNYDQTFSGPRLMREALANSLNLPAVALAQDVGIEDLHTFYKAMGLSLDKDASFYGVGMTLGNIEITPFELIQVYSAFAREGKRITPRFFKDKDVIEVATPLTPHAAYLVTDVLSDKIARREEFGENNPFDLSFALSVKTGTSTDFRDNWVVGYNRDFTVVVWVGNTDQRPMKRVSGITGAGPVLRDVTRYLATRFPMRPIPIVNGIKTAEVCALSGHKPGSHCQHTKKELFTDESVPTKTCEWHQEIFVKDCRGPMLDQAVKVSILPDDYQAWVKERPDWSVEDQINRECSFEEKKYQAILATGNFDAVIAKPISGSIYAIDPNIPRSLQKLKLSLSRFHQVKDVKWKHNGRQMKFNSPSIDWPMEKGLHQFEAELEFDNGNRSQTPSIEVKVL